MLLALQLSFTECCCCQWPRLLHGRVHSLHLAIVQAYAALLVMMLASSAQPLGLHHTPIATMLNNVLAQNYTCL
jgi:hypothetical protein